jgi:hypothetical protein
MASKDSKSVNKFFAKFFLAEAQRRKGAKEEGRGAERRLRTISSCGAGLIIFLLISLISCKTIPTSPKINLEKANSLPFEKDAFAYIFADAKKARSIIELLPLEELKNKETKQMLDRTRFFAAALFSQDSGRRYQLAAQGNYPRSQADFALSLNKSWQKRRSSSGVEYWHSPSSGVSILLGATYAYASASLTNEPLEPFTPTPGIEIPDGFNEFRKGAPLSCWIANPSVFLNRMFAGLPVQSVKSLYVNLLPAPEKKYEAVIRLQFENPSHARGLSVILALASGFSSSSNPLLSTFLHNLPVVNGNNVDIKSMPLGEKEIKILLELLL